ncbi:MAG: DinB family protein [Chloroflexota bacterium]
MNQQADLIDKFYEYNLWANTEMLKFCSSLTEEQLQTELAGTPGTIRQTLEHLVSSEGVYVMHATGSRPWPEDIDWESKSIDELLEMVKLSGSKLLEVASQVDPHTRHDRILDDGPYHFFSWTSLIQAIYHGIEHRTQIKVMLTKIGVEHPELASWEFRMEQYP